jgi:RNA polymerase sigma factor (sigma-70 family)
MVKGITDIELFERFQEGKPVAFIQIHRRFFPMMHRLAKAVVGVEEDAQDIVSEAFYKIFKNPQRFESLKHLETYLFVATKNAALDILRKRESKRLTQRELLYLTQEGEDHIDQERIAAKYLQKLVQEIDKLPAQAKAVMTLILGGHNTKEVAERLKLSPQTVLNYKGIAIKTLRFKFIKDNFIAAEIAFALLIIHVLL